MVGYEKIQTKLRAISRHPAIGEDRKRV